jgi:predicted acyl esterase
MDQLVWLATHILVSFEVLRIWTTGIVQWFIAATQPPSLKAIAPWEACGDLYREQFVRGGAWDNGLFDFITAHVIRGKNGLEDFKEMYRRSDTMNPYWEDKR